MMELGWTEHSLMTMCFYPFRKYLRLDYEEVRPRILDLLVSLLSVFNGFHVCGHSFICPFICSLCGVRVKGRRMTTDRRAW